MYFRYYLFLGAVLQCIALPKVLGKVVPSDCKLGKTYFTRVSFMTGQPDCVPCPNVSPKNDKACETDGPSQTAEDILNCKANCVKQITPILAESFSSSTSPSSFSTTLLFTSPSHSKSPFLSSTSPLSPSTTPSSSPTIPSSSSTSPSPSTCRSSSSTSSLSAATTLLLSATRPLSPSAKPLSSKILVHISDTPTTKSSSSPGERRFRSPARRSSTPSTHVHPLKNESKSVIVNISVGVSVTAVLLALVVGISFIVYRTIKNRRSAKNDENTNNETATGNSFETSVLYNHETTERQNGGRAETFLKLPIPECENDTVGNSTSFDGSSEEQSLMRENYM